MAGPMIYLRDIFQAKKKTKGGVVKKNTKIDFLTFPHYIPCHIPIFQYLNLSDKLIFVRKGTYSYILTNLKLKLKMSQLIFL